MQATNVVENNRLITLSITTTPRKVTDLHMSIEKTIATRCHWMRWLSLSQLSNHPRIWIARSKKQKQPCSETKSNKSETNKIKWSEIPTLSLKYHISVPKVKNESYKKPSKEMLSKDLMKLVMKSLWILKNNWTKILWHSLSKRTSRMKNQDDLLNKTITLPSKSSQLSQLKTATRTISYLPPNRPNRLSNPMKADEKRPKMISNHSMQSQIVTDLINTFNLRL